MTPTPDTPPTAPRRRRRLVRGLVALLLVGGLAAVPFAVARAAGGGCEPHGPPDPERAAAHLDRGVGFLLDRVEATDAQREQVDAALAGVADDLVRYRTEGGELREALHAALTAETVDAARVEAIRADGLALADEASRRLTGVMVEVASTLTAEQRAEVAELGPFGGPDGHRGGPGGHGRGPDDGGRPPR